MNNSFKRKRIEHHPNEYNVPIFRFVNKYYNSPHEAMNKIHIYFDNLKAHGYKVFSNNGTDPYIGYLVGQCENPKTYSYGDMAAECAEEFKEVLGQNRMVPVACTNIANLQV